jgi:uncharacterized BrkB/YihY/UPF0761 family membrane protein
MRKSKRTLKVKIQRFFQDERVQDIISILIFLGMIVLYSWLPDVKL